jgi:hypothetical protein
MPLGVIVLILNILPSILGVIPGLSPKIMPLISDVSKGLGALFASGVVTGPSASTALSAWAGVIAVLKQDPALPKNVLNLLGQIEIWIQNAVPVDQAAAQGVDWNQIHTIANV